jgi:hypothetical protein
MEAQFITDYLHNHLGLMNDFLKDLAKNSTKKNPPEGGFFFKQCFSRKNIICSHILS